MRIHQVANESINFKVIERASVATRCLQNVVSHQHSKSQAVERDAVEGIAPWYIHADQFAVQVLRRDTREGDR